MPSSSRKHKHNKTVKYRYIGGEGNIKSNIKSDRHGVLDMVGSKVGELAASMGNTIGDATLKIAGLEKIPSALSTNESDSDESNDSSHAVSYMDKTGAKTLDSVNEALSSEAVQSGIKQSAKQTADLVKQGAKTFNDALDDPEVKEEVKKALDHAGEIGSLVIEAGKEPFNKVVDVLAETVPKAASATVSGAIKVATDALGAVPVVGAVIDVGKMLNDGSKAASAVVEAGSDIAEVTSDAFKETTDNVHAGLQDLNEQKETSTAIADRTEKSIQQFTGGFKNKNNNKKTKRRLLKHSKKHNKKKSKRVQFAI